ncbi:TetR/AcrR family transcriptional regulator [Vreelandella massiliensis]|uniref:TetR/AcrR family transcriptional regulator n=1 Tax=Vreelandella massiliensis TaxID=1816686 RepID=UPI00096A36B4|nr:TetR/AcrR family transcriptional regulator [Halomonas massiliensis]
MNKKETTRARIREAAWALFAEHSFASTTTREIARRANVADGTVFSHYPNKIDILREGMEEQLSRIADTFLANWSGGSEREALIELASSFYGYYFEHVALSRSLLKEVLWDLDHFRNFDDSLLLRILSATTANDAIRTRLIEDSYFMTLVRHLSHEEPCQEAAINDFRARLTLLLPTS